MRTRSAAAALVDSGHVRVNGERVTAPSRLVRAEDVLTVALDRTVRVLKVASFVDKRGGAEAGRALYADLTPTREAAESQPGAAVRDAGAGRPSKRERRAIDRLYSDED